MLNRNATQCLPERIFYSHFYNAIKLLNSISQMLFDAMTALSPKLRCVLWPVAQYAKPSTSAQ